jgi:hypothetical protein
MNILHLKLSTGYSVPIILIVDFGLGRIRNEESIMGVSGGVLLRLEQSIEVEKTRFYKLVGWHFRKPHL